MYPTKSEAPYAATLMKVKTKEYKFKYTDVSGGKVFEADNKTYTAGAGAYLKAALKAVSTAQDDWRFHDFANYLIFQCFHMQGIPDSETREDNFVEPYDWGRLEFRDFFNTIFKLPRVMEPIVKTNKDALAKAREEFILIKDLKSDPVTNHHVTLSPAVIKGHLLMINNKLKKLPGVNVKYVAGMTGVFALPRGRAPISFNKPTFTMTVLNSEIPDSSPDALMELELHPKFFVQMGMCNTTTTKIKMMNWDNCEDTACVEVNDQAVSSNGTPTQGFPDYLFHTSTLLGPTVWEWTTTYRRLYIPIQATGNINDYTSINNVQINQRTPLCPLDMDIQPTEASKVDTRVECPNLLYYSQQYFTHPQNRDLLRRVSRKLKEGGITTAENNSIEEIQFVNVLYHKIHDNVRKLKRLRINLTEDDHDVGAVDKIRYPAGSKSMVALTFQPRRKRPRLAEEHSFQIHCTRRKS